MHACFADLFKGQGLAKNWFCGPMRKTMFLNSGSDQNLTPIRVMGHKNGDENDLTKLQVRSVGFYAHSKGFFFFCKGNLKGKKATAILLQVRKVFYSLEF